MLVRLHPGSRVLWRSATHLQIGRRGQEPVVFCDPDEEQLEMLQNLENGAAIPNKSDPLISALTRANLLLPRPQPTFMNIHHALRHRLRFDAKVLAQETPQGQGWPEIDRRHRTAVQVQSLGKTGSTLARLLAHAGVGTVITGDEKPVTSDDVGPGGFLTRHIDQKRTHALQVILAQETPEVVVKSTREEADFAVLISHHMTNPVHYQRLMRNDVPHLPVEFHDGGVRIGPFVRPGESACLKCLDLHRMDDDPAWPFLATQLMNLDLKETLVEETVLAGTAAHLVAGQVLDAIAGRRPETIGASLEVMLPSIIPAEREWLPHPECGCLTVS